ncbi:hypothetical protein [Erythrobacter dokdonensis]|uniref:hypothetical protein n=1 Tax=Erythrobacter dokdonensis TaxID=328225 RepID=UPI00117DF224|nr:hypothetical protein [Erythrobacter dokdonensis]
MIGALLLAASPPAQFGLSPLVDPTHEHDWQPLGEEESGKVWWDKNAIDKASIDGVEYPKIVLRQIPSNDHWLSKWYAFVDAAWAVDCSTNQLAQMDEAANGKRAEPWVGHAPRPSFRSIPEIETAEVRSMMRAVCGEDWAP